MAQGPGRHNAMAMVVECVGIRRFYFPHTHRLRLQYELNFVQAHECR